VTDDHGAEPYHPSRAQAGPLFDGPDPAETETVPGTPAEAQFPYLATQGLQPAAESPASPEPDQPLLRNRRPGMPRSGRWLPVLIGTAAGLFVLGVLAAYLTWGATGNPMAGPEGPDATPHGAVQGYLEALAARDAEAALGFALTAPGDTTMLTDEVLNGLMQDSPITAIEVAEAGQDSSYERVTASYLLGTRQVNASFDVLRQGEVWRLEEVAAQVQLDTLPLGEVPLSLNGVPLATASPSLFPGSYTLATSAARFTVANPDFVVDSPSAAPQVDASLALSQAGQAEVIRAAKAHLAACVKKHDLDPKDCGFAITNPKGTKLKPSTMRWSVHSGGDHLGRMELSLDHPGSVTADVDIAIRGDVRGTDGSRWQAGVRLHRMRADLAGEDVSVQFG